VNKLTRILMVLILAVFICLPGRALADFTLIDVFGGRWQNDPPTPGPIDRIDTFIMAGNYGFSDPGTINFSNPGWTGKLITNTWTEATSPTSFTGNMNWNYSFAGSYTTGSLITLAVNYYDKGHFVIAEEWTWGSNGSGGWSGGSSPTPVGHTPLPASALLLGTGLFGMGLLGFRRQKS
jgi:hypothetical protein